MTGLVCGNDDAAFGARSAECPCGTGGKIEWQAAEIRRIGATADRGGTVLRPGRGARRGGVNCAACSNRDNSGRFRLYDCAAAPDGTGRSFRNDSRIGQGVMMRRTPEKRPKGPCPGISRPVPSVVWGGDYSTVSETRKSSPEAGSVTTMLRSSLVKWK